MASISDDALFAQIGSALGLPPVVVPLGAGAGSGSSSGASASAGAGSGAGASGAVREVHAPLVLGELLVALSHCEDRCAELLPLRIDLLAAASASAPASAAASAAAGPPALPLTLVTVGAVGRRPLQVLAPNQALRIPVSEEPLLLGREGLFAQSSARASSVLFLLLSLFFTPTVCAPSPLRARATAGAAGGLCARDRVRVRRGGGSARAAAKQGLARAALLCRGRAARIPVRSARPRARPRTRARICSCICIWDARGGGGRIPCLIFRRR